MGKHAAPDRYAVWKLTYLREGRIDAFVDDQRIPVRPDSLLTVPPQGIATSPAG